MKRFRARSRVTKGLALAAALGLLAGLSACGELQNRTTAAKTLPMTLMLDYFPNADHVGIYQALAEGDFKRAGLDVHVESPSDASAPLKDLLAGRADVAISYEPELMLARDQGKPLAAFGAIVQQPLTSIVSIGSKHITSVADLRVRPSATPASPIRRLTSTRSSPPRTSRSARSS